MKKVIFHLAVLLPLIATSAKADHDSPMGSIGRLMYETTELQREVNYSWLRHHVKASVNRFTYDVQALFYCAQQGFRNTALAAPRPDHTEEVGCPHWCRQQMARAQYSFDSVSRYLYDTNWDYPNVYRAWLHTQDAIRRIY
jgi:hypothetical protein